MNKAVKLGCLALSGVLLLSGCGENVAKQTLALQAYDNGEDKDVTLKVGDNYEGDVFRYVTDKILLNTSTLIAPTEQETSDIGDTVKSISDFLRGRKNGALSSDLANYMLMEFTKTPYEWMQDTASENGGYSILGVDPKSQKIFVDVTYKTTSNLKSQIPASAIVLGSPYESALKEERYNAYMKYLQAKVASETVVTDVWSDATTNAKQQESAKKKVNTLKTAFESTWGNIDDILTEQQSATLLTRLYNQITAKKAIMETTTGVTTPTGTQTTVPPKTEVKNDLTRGIGQLMYSGQAKNTDFLQSGLMSFRFVLSYNYNLGIRSALKVDSVYLKSFILNGYEDTLNTYTSQTNLDLTVLAPYLDRLINSYHLCIEESNYTGLYKLFSTQALTEADTSAKTSLFADWDKYYEDLNKYAYHKYAGYSYEVIGAKDDTIYVKVNQTRKVRGKGTNMTFPSYDEVTIFTIKGANDKLYIASEVPLSSTLSGDPQSMVSETNSISDDLQFSSSAFSAENKDKVLTALRAFSKMQLVGETSGGNFVELVDHTISESAMNSLVETMSAVKANEKVVLLKSWSSSSNTYCRVKLKELYVGTEYDLETESYVSLVNREGTWKVLEYSRTSTNKIKKGVISDTGCLTHDYVDKDSTNDFENSETQIKVSEGTETTAPAETSAQ